jgi:hypothetical protein
MILNTLILRTSLKPFLLVVSCCFSFVLAKDLGASTYTFNNKIIASNGPFGICPPGTDTIIIRDTFLIDVSYYPFINGVPFDGVLLVDGGVLYWTSNVKFNLGANACIRLKDGGHIYPNNIATPGCSALKTLFFDVLKYASCSGGSGLRSFSEINTTGCANCCDSPSSVPEIFNDLPSEIVDVIPNPAEGGFILKVKSQSRMKGIEIFDISGHCCAKFLDLNTDQFEVIRHDLSPGLYFVRVVFEDGMVTKKVILL